MKIRWVVNGVAGDRSSGWSSSLASNRYRAILPASALIGAGHDVDLLDAESWRWQAAEKDTVFVIGKLLPGRDLAHFRELSRSVLDQTTLAVAAGARVIGDFNDDHFEHPLLGEHWRGLAQAVTACTVGSEGMGEALRRHTTAPSMVIGDPLGSPWGEPRVFERESGLSKWSRGLLSGGRTPRLKFVWYGNPGNWPAMQQWLERLAPLASDQPFLLWVVTQPLEHIEQSIAAFNQRHGPSAIAEVVPWEEEVQWSVVADADVVLVPSDVSDPRKAVKTSNRLADALHAGRYVIASPVPAYSAFGETAVLTLDPLAAARAYLADPSTALARVRRGQADVQAAQGTEAVGNAWASALTRLSIAPRSLSTTTVAATADVRRPLVRLNLGCGDKILPGYVNVDVVEARAGRQPDVVCDLRDLSAFSTGSADEVLAVHVVEHFWRWEVEGILREWVRVLKPGGRMVLECPNLQSACEAFLADPEAGSLPDKSGQRTMWVFYGDPQWRDPLMVHRWGYTPRSLARLMETVGLVNARQEPAQYKLREPRDMRIVAEKPMDALT